MEEPVMSKRSAETPGESACEPRPTQQVDTDVRNASSHAVERAISKKIVDVACWPCRKRKGKCSGGRPSCTSCVRRGIECTYEYDEGLTRIGSLRLKLHQSTTRTENLEYLYLQLRSRPDNEAALLLAIIRLGADVDKIVAQLKSAPDLSWAKGKNPPDIAKLLDGVHDVTS